MATIAIIGAGFSGAALACRLLASAPRFPLDLLLINRSGEMARGLAYGTASPHHLLNVPAAQMTLDADDPDGFVRFARRRETAMTRASFVSRQRFGEYLSWSLEQAERRALRSRGPQLERLVGQVVSAEPEAGGWTLQLGDGRQRRADAVVLALGHFRPRWPLPDATCRAIAGDRRVINDPWAIDHVPRGDGRRPIVMLGTGLTMLDGLISLRADGHDAPVIALSRRGLQPSAHRGQAVPPPVNSLLAVRLSSERRTVAMLRAVRAEMRRIAAIGGDWRDVFSALRKATPDLWQRLPVVERRRFLRHLQPWWDAHRHRCAPGIDAFRQAEIDRGRLSVQAGKLCSVQPTDAGLQLQWRPRGGSTLQTLEAAALINCTGPTSDLTRIADPLVTQLRVDGRIVADELNLGLRVDANNQPLDAQGQASPGLYYVGPLLRARDWEATAVPELRLQADRLAARLMARFEAPASLMPISI